MIKNILIIFLAATILSGCNLSEYRAKVKATTIENVDLQQVKGGIYQGECDFDLVRALVAVQIKDHQIVSVNLLQHDNGWGKKAEVIVDRIKDQQSLEVDVVTGATASSKAILKAAERALRKGI